MASLLFLTFRWKNREKIEDIPYFAGRAHEM